MAKIKRKKKTVERDLFAIVNHDGTRFVSIARKGHKDQYVWATTKVPNRPVLDTLQEAIAYRKVIHDVHLKRIQASSNETKMLLSIKDKLLAGKKPTKKEYEAVCMLGVTIPEMLVEVDNELESSSLRQSDLVRNNKFGIAKITITLVEG